MIKKQILILARHAARDFQSGGDALSSEGHLAASRFGPTLIAMNLPPPTELIASPKTRTKATLRFIAEERKLETKIDHRLDERGPTETIASFTGRVQKFFQECDEAALKNELSVRIACSHFDWLEEAALQISSDENDIERSESWSPLSFRVYFFEDGLWRRVRNIPPKTTAPKTTGETK